MIGFNATKDNPFGVETDAMRIESAKHMLTTGLLNRKQAKFIRYYIALLEKEQLEKGSKQ